MQLRRLSEPAFLATIQKYEVMIISLHAGTILPKLSV